MKRICFLLGLILFPVLISSAQFFIPIFIPYTTQTYVCKSKNLDALEHYRTGMHNFNQQASVSVAHFSEAIKLDSFFCDAYYGLTQK